ncbi:integration host factor subunit beta [Chloracidobacterium thermophilum]|uniref:integration host factor subunit beta n=1 Tax=Chloracidobacterium thermophilum TaxID=458033 RepID=UPI00240FB1B1|nr:integration host factor subunit beta [Chloracidobacterium thermophilum]
MALVASVLQATRRNSKTLLNPADAHVQGRARLTMTKADLVEVVARAADLTKKDAEVVVEEVFAAIIESLNRGEKIELRGFGSFRIRQRNSRRGRNPKTGDAVDIPAKAVPYFKPGKELRELINQRMPSA